MTHKEPRNLLHSPRPRNPISNPYGATDNYINILKGLLKGKDFHPADRKKIIDFIDDFNKGVDRLQPPDLSPGQWNNHWDYDPPEHPGDKKFKLASKKKESFQSSPSRVANLLYDHPTSSPQSIPPRLVRRDGGSLTQAEVLYPAMAYNEKKHELWPGQRIRR